MRAAPTKKQEGRKNERERKKRKKRKKKYKGPPGLTSIIRARLLFKDTRFLIQLRYGRANDVSMDIFMQNELRFSRLSLLNNSTARMPFLSVMVF